MSKHVCTGCKTDYKYNSYLQRHIRSKKGCKIINNVNANIIPNNVTIPADILIQNTLPANINIQDLFKKFIDILKNNDTEIINFDLLNNYNINNDNNVNNVNTDNNVNNVNTDNNVINVNKDSKTSYNCSTCSNNFRSRQSLHTHIKLKRCKGKDNEEEKVKSNGLTLNDILNSNVLDSNNININGDNNNNTTTNNNTTNNNITININPFGCESLQHISIKDFSSIFKNFDQLNIILYKLSNLIYIKNNNNMNFTKYNMNKNIVTYLSRDMELKTLSEREFIKEFEKNIKKLCIELFYIHKNNLSVNDLIEFMKSLLLYYEMISDTKPKLNRIELKEQLKSVMESVFRNEEIKVMLKNVEKEILNNPKTKINSIKKNIKRTLAQNEGLDDHDYKPKEDNKDEKNLNRIREKAMAANLEDSKKYVKT